MRFTRESLESKTLKELRSMCVGKLSIPGMTKKTKDVVIDAILAKYSDVGTGASVAPATTKSEGVSGIEGAFQSTLTKPDAPFGSRTTTTLQVSCGASSGRFPVVGKTVAQVGEFLREVLNVDKLSTGLVNGKEVEGSYMLRSGDVLEFLKPAGRKG